MKITSHPLLLVFHFSLYVTDFKATVSEWKQLKAEDISLKMRADFHNFFALLCHN